MRRKFTYDGLDRRVRIVEKNGTEAVTSDRYSLWDGMRIADERAPGVVAPTRGHSTPVDTLSNSLRPV